MYKHTQARQARTAVRDHSLKLLYDRW